MKSLFCWLLFFFSLLHPSPGQTGCDITVRLEGYRQDSLWLGHTYGRRGIPDIPAVRQPDGSFRIKTDAELPEGMVAIVYQDRGTSKGYLSCWLVDGQRNFTLETQLSDKTGRAKVEGSPENTLFYEYLGRYDDFSNALNVLTADWKVFQDEASYRAMVAKQEEFRKYQEYLVRQHPGSRTAGLVQETLFLTPDEPFSTDWQVDATERHRWFRQHFFDRMDLGSGKFLQYPLWVERADYYFAKLPPPEPDSMIVMIDEIFDRLRPDQEGFQYYFGYIMNSIARMSRHRTDEVFVHFVREYVDTGKSAFLDSGRNRRYQDDANRMEPLFVGKPCPEVTLYDRQGQAVLIRDVDAPYTLLLFWLYDCSHCKKEIPEIEKLYGQFVSKGLKVLSVCGKNGPEESPKCWEFAEQMQMPADWLLLNDPQRRSRFSTLLNIRSYPNMILLDKDKNILFKQTGEVPPDVLEKELGKVIR